VILALKPTLVDFSSLTSSRPQWMELVYLPAKRIGGMKLHLLNEVGLLPHETKMNTQEFHWDPID
jgi:hypothetical protein